jgi:hypothetical protein
MENRVLKLLAKSEFRHPVVHILLSCLVFLAAFSSPAAITFKAMNSFSSATGAQPFGQLLRATNGLFYGTTASGGEWFGRNFFGDDARRVESGGVI